MRCGGRWQLHQISSERCEMEIRYVQHKSQATRVAVLRFARDLPVRDNPTPAATAADLPHQLNGSSHQTSPTWHALLCYTTHGGFDACLSTGRIPLTACRPRVGRIRTGGRGGGESARVSCLERGARSQHADLTHQLRWIVPPNLNPTWRRTHGGFDAPSTGSHLLNCSPPSC